MRKCDCGKVVPRSAVIGGRRRNLRNRTKCLVCLPFESSIYRKKTTAEKLARKSRNAKTWYARRKLEDGIDPIAARRIERRNAAIAILGGKCQICGYDKCNRNLAFHHLRDKQLNLTSREFQLAAALVISEIKKCVLVCR